MKIWYDDVFDTVVYKDQDKQLSRQLGEKINLLLVFILFDYDSFYKKNWLPLLMTREIV